jgi:hypothetical protein
MHILSHEIALEGIEIYNMHAKCIEILSCRDVGARISWLFVWRAKRRERHEVVVIPVSAILGHCTLSVVLGTCEQIHDMKECRGPVSNVGTSVGELTGRTTRKPSKYGEDRCRWGLLSRCGMTAQELYPITTITVVSRTYTLNVSLHETRNINVRSENKCA